MLAPVIGVLGAWVQLGEKPTVIELYGMAFIALALLIISIHTIRAHHQIEPAMGQD
jgi:drug/metabolite transporter (DMT)-like permease